MADVHRDIRSQTGRYSAGDVAIGCGRLEVAVAHVEVACETLCRVSRLDQQRAACRIAPKERALRAFQRLDLLDIVERQQRSGRGSNIYAVEIQCDRILDVRNIRAERMCGDSDP
jgi:F0F1-type ATP synthase epsilon subunit